MNPFSAFMAQKGQEISSPDNLVDVNGTWKPYSSKNLDRILCQ